MRLSSNNNKDHQFLGMPQEIQVRTLTYLRAFDLVAVQQTCHHFNRPEFIHSIVAHAAEQVYPSHLTEGFAHHPVQSEAAGRKSSKIVLGKEDGMVYTLEHLRNMELLVIARVLNSPEPSTGYVVCKSWCKTALKWLEATPSNSSNKPQGKQKKKMSKRKERMRARKLSDISPPWPDVNAEILCEHRCLSRCSNGKTARARRRYVDRHAWKILKKLYPDSTSLPTASGECIQCLVEAEMTKKTQRDKEEALKLERKRPLSDPILRRFYTRRTGVPSQCLRKSPPGNTSVDEKIPSRCCPLTDGRYYVVPREWCHRWRKYIRTGEGGPCGAPDAACLVCDAHSLLLLPPHLESFLAGDNPQLLASHDFFVDVPSETPQSPIMARAAIPGQAPDQAAARAMMEAGLSTSQISQQLSALRLLEQQRVDQNVMLDNIDAPVAASTPSKNELLDRENHSVVEILSQQEYQALEAFWPPGSSFGLFMEIRQGRDVWGTQLCRDCDATGRSHDFHVKNRARGWVKKSSDKARAPASLEY